MYIPKTIDTCFDHNGYGEVIGIKNDNNEWNIAGHKNRIIEVDDKVLELFATLYDEVGTPALHARLPALHSKELLQVLEKFANQPQRLGDLRGQYYSTPSTCWNEVNAQQDGTMTRQTQFPRLIDQWILSGPHFFVGTPLYQTPRKVCETHKAYDSLDLVNLPDDYLPRTNYLPACDPEEYQRRTSRVSWIEEGEIEAKLVTDYYRFVNRRMFGSESERSFISTIMPIGAAHINTVVSTAFKDNKKLVNFIGFSHSVMGTSNNSILKNWCLLISIGCIHKRHDKSN